MANWFYTDANGQKQGPVNNAQLVALVKQGIIAQETIVENEQGKSAPARKVKGLVFPETPTNLVESAKVSMSIQVEINGVLTSVTKQQLFDLAAQGVLQQDSVIDINGKKGAASKIKGLVFGSQAMPQPAQAETYDFASLPFSSNAEPNPFLDAPPVDNNPFVAPVAFRAPVQTSTPKPCTTLTDMLTKSIGGLFVLGLVVAIFFGSLMSLGIIKPKGNRQENSRQNFVFSLKEPPDDKHSLSNLVEGKIGTTIKITAAMLVFDECTSAAQKVYKLGNAFENEDKMPTKMSQLGESYHCCYWAIAATLINAGNNKKDFPGIDVTFRVVTLGNIESGCINNLEQMLASLKRSVQELDSVKYENTHKFLEILSQIHEGVTKPEKVYADSKNSGIGFGTEPYYTIPMLALMRELDETRSRAEQEW
ncbi:MAG: hypothetical protein ACRC46_11355 [Thermoguttaceae bacterium]